MKKLVITLVIASLHTGSAFAAGGSAAKGAAKELGELKGGKQEVIRPGAAGSKVDAKGVSQPGQAASAGSSAQPQQKAAANLSTNHNSCPATSPVAQLNSRQQAILFEGVGAGLGENGCAESFETKGAVEKVVAIREAELTELKQQGLSDLSQARPDQRVKIRVAGARAAGTALGTDEVQGKETLKQLCANKCDVESAALCNTNL